MSRVRPPAIHSARIHGAYGRAERRDAARIGLVSLAPPKRTYDVVYRTGYTIIGLFDPIVVDENIGLADFNMCCRRGAARRGPLV